MAINTLMSGGVGVFPLQFLPSLNSPPKTLLTISPNEAEVYYNTDISFVIGLRKPIVQQGFEISINGGDFIYPQNTDLYLTKEMDYLHLLHGEPIILKSFVCKDFSRLWTIRIRVYTGGVYTIKVNTNGTKVKENAALPELVLV